MSPWITITSKLKEILSRMLGIKVIEQQLKISPIISSKMEEAIDLWTRLYMNNAPWLHEPTDQDPTRIASLGLPGMIANEKARTALLEFESEITTPTETVEIKNPDYPGEPQTTIGPDGEEIPLPSTVPPETITEDRVIGDTARAEYLESQYKKLKKQLRRQLEYGIAKGGLVIKPYVVINQSVDEQEKENTSSTIKIEFDYTQADAFFPLAFDAAGRITEAAFLQRKMQGESIYYRLEYHKWKNNTATIINKAFKASNDKIVPNSVIFDLGEEVPLSKISEWKDLQPKTTINNVEKPLFAYFKMPEANTIDMTSPLGVSGFSKATSLIKDADMQYSRLLWEYEGGELAIDIDRDALKTVTDASGNDHTQLTKLQERLYRKIDLGTEETYQPFAPSLRDANYMAGLNTILMRIEDVCSISRGTLSDATQEAKTATELKILKQRSYQANADIQQALEDTLKDVVYIMDVYCTLYEITPQGEYDVSFEWDDSLIVDTQEELNTRLSLMQQGLVSKVENRMWYFGETERQAEEALRKIDEENTQSMENELVMEQNLSDGNVKTNNTPKPDKGDTK